MASSSCVSTTPTRRFSSTSTSIYSSSNKRSTHARRSRGVTSSMRTISRALTWSRRNRTVLFIYSTMRARFRAAPTTRFSRSVTFCTRLIRSTESPECRRPSLVSSIMLARSSMKCDVSSIRIAIFCDLMSSICLWPREIWYFRIFRIDFKEPISK